MSNNYWEDVYQSKQVDQVSWYQQQDQKTLELIQSQNLSPDVKIIDVGSGASLLIDQLVEAGYKNLHVLDLSETALKATRERLSGKGVDISQIHWQVADICTVVLEQQFFDLWHDRAVFHFMVTEEQQEQYLQNVRYALKQDGILMISTFAEDGPTQCSGLPVERYSVEKLAQRLGEGFQLVHHDISIHLTPWDTKQNFIHTMWLFKR
ncbi:methyltransferase domain-containing protein [Acinetobacter sp. ESBL14]|uniref:methyltransferase domain-containing protein n=1 Tax=Acinetobacter sp. ESBL14 TaxID=3077329 RepID=UPI002FCC62EB